MDDTHLLFNVIQESVVQLVMLKQHVHLVDHGLEVDALSIVLKEPHLQKSHMGHQLLALKTRQLLLPVQQSIQVP